MHKTKAFYNFLSPYYCFINYFLKPHKTRLMEEVNKLPPGDLLEIGVGTGSHLHMYKSHQITGIDISPKMLKYAKKKALDSTKIIEMNGENLSFHNTHFNYVVISHTLAVTKDPELLLQEAFRVLKPDGKMLILNHFTPSNFLKYTDTLFSPISQFFHFNSLFYVHQLKSLQKFTLEKGMALGRLNYTQLLIYSKA